VCGLRRVEQLKLTYPEPDYPSFIYANVFTVKREGQERAQAQAGNVAMWQQHVAATFIEM